MKKNLKLAVHIIIIILITMLIVITMCYFLIKDNPDFAPYTNEKYSETYDIKSDLYNLAETKDEMTNIAQKYEKGIKLTSITYYIQNKNNGMIEYEFFKNSYGGENKACSILIKVDIQSKKTTEILYTKGHGKRVTGYEDEINNKLNENILNYIKEEDKNITIIVTNFGINKLNR